MAGITTCVLLELTGIFDYGSKLPEEVRSVLSEFDAEQEDKRNGNDKAKLIIQAIIGILLG